ncbi:MAG: YdcF family protein [Pseudomonadota bacterium]
MNTEPSGESSANDTPGKRSGGKRWLIRLAALIVFVIILCIGIFVGSFVRFSRDVIHLETPAEVTKADGIVVLTGASRRIGQAVELLDGGFAERLLISGVNPATTAGQIQSLTQAEPALFECCVDIDHNALDTIGNAEETAAWIEEHGYDSIIVVTSNYHMPRSLLLLRRANSETEYIPYPIMNNDLRHLQWLQQPGALRGLLAEYVKFLAARLRIDLRRKGSDQLESG